MSEAMDGDIGNFTELRKLKDYCKSVLMLAPIGKGEELLKKFTYYLDAEEEHNNAEKEQLASEIENQKKN